MADQIVGYARRQRGSRVGKGQCFDLVDTALRGASAKSAADYGKISPNADYTWGTSVTLADLQPGDVIQFRNYTYDSTVVTKTDKATTTDEVGQDRPHHTRDRRKRRRRTARSPCWSRTPRTALPSREPVLYFKDSTTTSGNAHDDDQSDAANSGSSVPRPPKGRTAQDRGRIVECRSPARSRLSCPSRPVVVLPPFRPVTVSRPHGPPRGHSVSVGSRAADGYRDVPKLPQPNAWKSHRRSWPSNRPGARLERREQGHSMNTVMKRFVEIDTPLPPETLLFHRMRARGGTRSAERIRTGTPQQRPRGSISTRCWARASPSSSSSSTTKCAGSAATSRASRWSACTAAITATRRPFGPGSGFSRGPRTAASFRRRKCRRS